jgi:probable rRNA maturation factor
MKGGADRLPTFELSVREEGVKLPVPKKQLEELTALTFRAADREPGDVSLVVSDDGFIAALNEKYLGVQGPTDVLSFPLREASGEEPPRRGSPKNRSPRKMVSEARSSRRGSPKNRRFPSAHLGDIVVSVDTADLQARAAGRKLAEEFRLLYLHGLLHLLGFTHDAARDGARMSEMQR